MMIYDCDVGDDYDGFLKCHWGKQIVAKYDHGIF